MRRSGYLCVLVAALAAMILMTASPVTMAATSSGTFTITLTDCAISTSPASPTGGDHVVVIKNNSSKARGVEMTGVDKAGSTYVRYTKVLPKGKSEKFKWYFPSTETVYIKDLLSCEHKARTCVIVTFGGMRTSVKFK
jgi:hypothetical protein